MHRCPACGKEAPRKDGVGDLVDCDACGAPFWALEWEKDGRAVAPPEKAPPSAAGIFGLHAGVLAAEVLLASTVIGVFVGFPVFGLGRLFGFW